MLSHTDWFFYLRLVVSIKLRYSCCPILLGINWLVCCVSLYSFQGALPLGARLSAVPSLATASSVYSPRPVLSTPFFNFFPRFFPNPHFSQTFSQKFSKIIFEFSQKMFVFVSAWLISRRKFSKTVSFSPLDTPLCRCRLKAFCRRLSSPASGRCRHFYFF